MFIRFELSGLSQITEIIQVLLKIADKENEYYGLERSF